MEQSKMTNWEDYPVGIQSFAKLREKGFIYVDKTRYIYDLTSKGGFYFLSRPRRFGKSLLLSTIEAYYRGQRDLFRGLALDSLTEDWEPRPVLHLDLNNCEYLDLGSLEAHLSRNLSEWETEYECVSEGSVGSRFATVIKEASIKTGKKVVILVDEYDKPMLSAIDRLELADRYRGMLKSFYSNLKTMDAYIEFAMLTGVARFSKVSIFSDLNNLNDITFSDRYSGICGVTRGELEEYFKKGIAALGAKQGMDREEVISRLRHDYDGYHFSENAEDVYNPFSLLCAFDHQNFGKYWFATGTPTYLVKLLQKGRVAYSSIAPTRVEKDYLETAGILSEDLVPVFYQSGYLTIKGYDPEFRTYTLDYPNAEVRQGFLSFLLVDCVPGTANSALGISVRQFVEEARAGNPEGFMDRLNTLLANIPYSEKGSKEDHFQNAVYLLFALMGFYAHVERRTSDGRIDLVVETANDVYLFEFKINRRGKKGMEQMLEKRYEESYRHSGKRVWLIAASFSTRTGRLTDRLIRPAGR